MAIPRAYTSYVGGDRVYDYDATFRAISPYLHAEISPAERLCLTGGLRFDHMHYSYDNGLAMACSPAARFYYRPADNSTTYRHWARNSAIWAASRACSLPTTTHSAHRAKANCSVLAHPAALQGWP